MPMANGENYKVVLPEAVVASVTARLGIPENALSVRGWTEHGRLVQRELKRLMSHPNTTLQELIDEGVSLIPRDYASALLAEASKGRVGLGEPVDGENRVTFKSDLWRRVFDGYLPDFLMEHTDGQVSAVGIKYLIEDINGILSDKARILDLVRAARGAKMETIRKEHPIPPASRKASFQYFITKFRDSLTIESDVLRMIDPLPHGTRASRTWGSEVEACSAFGVYPPEGWKSKGDGSLRQAATDHDPECILKMETREYVEYDENGILIRDSRYCSCGFSTDEHLKEFVSPVLYSYHSKGLEYLTARLGRRAVNQSPGMHIHVNATDPSGKSMTPSQLASLVYGYELLEPLWAGEYRREGDSRERWAKSFGADRSWKLVKHLKDQGFREKIDSGSFGSDRYYAVNLLSLQSHGTIEFRAMGPAYDYEHMIRWAHFCREMVNVAQAGFPKSGWQKVRSFKDLIKVFAKYGKETPMPSWASDITPEQFVVEHELVGASIEH